MHKPSLPVKLRVRYAETDQMSVAHHTAYPVWLEVARSAIFHAVGLPYTEWEKRDVFLVVGELTCRYRRPAHYDEEVTVWVRAQEAASRCVVFAYRVEGPDASLLAEAENKHVAVDRATGRSRAIPEEMRSSLCSATRVP